MNYNYCSKTALSFGLKLELQYEERTVNTVLLLCYWILTTVSTPCTFSCY